MSAPSTHRVEANGLLHHVLEWPRAAAMPAGAAGHLVRGAGAGEGVSGTRPATVMLIHGYMDAAGTWDLVAPALAHAGLRVLAPDMRGFGEGPRVPKGAYYHFVDYVFDVADLVEHLCPGEPVALVGHSMGGTIATMFAGAFPERVLRLGNLEGLGPPDHGWGAGPSRMRAWIEQVRSARQRAEARPTYSPEEALRRLAANHPAVPTAVLAHRLRHLAEEVPGTDGRLAWRFDALHRTTSPFPFFAKLFAAYAKQITCPVLFVSGGPTGFHPPDEAERLEAFANAARAEIEDAGHMMHWTRPEKLAELLVPFLTQ